MSWQLAIFAVLALTLAGGALWYERSRPPAQVVALVAALAALSIAGRVALSPVPNVVPSTDIVLIAGYALGGAPGFAVGALTALVSNFWLGQGPWTPWQMAGWGLTGLLGAILAAATGRRLGRVPLALACALAGLAYGALLDLSLMVTYGGEQSLDRFLALSARGVPFNVAHAAGNFALALVAGPALVRMLLRYRSRFEFAWGGGAPPSAPGGDRPPGSRGSGGSGGGGRSRLAAGAACALAAIAIAAAALPDDAARGAGGGSAGAWLRAAQNPDGGFGTAPGEPSSPGMTGWAVLGLEAAGTNPRDLRRGANTPVSYLRDTVSQITTTGDVERTVLVLAAAGLDPRRFGGRDLIARLLARRGADGSWGRQVNPTAFGVLALAAAGRTAGNRRSAAWLRGAANDDGGWGFVPGASSDADSTGAALQALAATGGSRRSIRAGVAWLRRAQRPGGGFALQGGPVNAQSTAWAIQGLIAAGVQPRSLRRGGRSPLDYLASVRARDGHYRYSAATDQTPVWVTGQAIQAVAGRAFPLPAVPARSASKRSGGTGRATGGGARGASGSGTSGTGASGAGTAGSGVPGAPGGSAASGAAGATGVPGAAAKPGGADQATAGGAGGADAPTGTGAAGGGASAAAGASALSPFEEGADTGPAGGEDGSDLPLYGAIALAALALGAGAWALRRRRRA